MIPDNRVSTTAHHAAFNDPTRGPVEYLRDYERAGVALYDGTKGMQVKVWEGRVVDKMEVQVSAPGVPWTSLFTRAVVVEEISIAFDNNMFPFVTFTEASGGAWIYWFDSSDNTQKFTQLPAGTVSPRCCIDDHRPSQNANSDVVLAYLRGGSLYVRYQRERYGTEYLMQAGLGANARLVDVGMNRIWRLQFRLRNANHVAGAAVFTDPFLADVAADLLRRSGISPKHIDVSRLYDQTVEGYRVASQGGADAMLKPLQSAYFFDPGSWDKKLRFVPRGTNEPVAHLTFDDLLERDSPLSIERVQEVELLRKVNVTMVDSTAGWVPNKQTAERRSATIKATGELSDIVPITGSPDFIATVAAKRLRVPWGEPNKFKYGLGTPWSVLTPTDVVMLEDQRGRTFRMRLMEQSEDYGQFDLEASTDADWVYSQTATGTTARPSSPPVAGIAGDTKVVVLNIPVLRDQDDELGYYVAVYGTGRAWVGGVAEMATRGLASTKQSIAVDIPALAGSVVTALLPETSSEYLSDQTLRVKMFGGGQLESVARDEVLQYANLAAVQRADGSWEVLQFQTATTGPDGTYDLTGLVRGRYATEPLIVPVDAMFVVLDDAVMFVQFQKWMLGRPISYRGITLGQNPDDVAWIDLPPSEMQSQVEWPVAGLKGVRTGSSVVISWVARPRLGVETDPYHSKYFDGYGIICSDLPFPIYVRDGTTTYTRTSVAVGTTITVHPLNSATKRTGPGRSIVV